MRSQFEVKVGWIVINPPELATPLCRQWNTHRVHLIGFAASNEAHGAWRTKNPTCPIEDQSAVAPETGQGQGFTSRIMLKGVSIALRKWVKPAS
jgi:hypothetical protein